MQTRREFLKIGAALTAGTLLAGGCSHWLPVPEEKKTPEPPKEKTLNLAFFGLGVMGMADLEALLHVKGVRVVALCDPDSRRCVRAQRLLKKLNFPEAEIFSDYRKVFDNTRERIDGAVVATPDHSHFAVAMASSYRLKFPLVRS